MNMPLCLGILILKLNKILIHGFWFDHVKPKYGKKANLCYMKTESFLVHIKTDDIYKDISILFEIPLPERKHEKIIRLKKDEVSGKIMTKFCWVIVIVTQ